MRVLKKLLILLIFPIIEICGAEKKQITFPVEVSVEARVLDMESIKESNGTFAATVETKYLWTDPSLAFNAKEFGVTKKTLNHEESLKKLAQIWHPKIRINNLQESTNKQYHGLLIESNGRVSHIITTQGNFTFLPNVQAFPFDSQKVSILLKSSENNTNEIHMVHGEKEEVRSGIKIKSIIPLWSIGNFKSSSSINNGWDGALYQNLEFSFICKRSSMAYVPVIFFPYVIVMLFPMILLWVGRSQLMGKVGFILSSIIALITLQFTIYLMNPGCLTYNNLITHVFALGYIYQIIILAFVCWYEEYNAHTIYQTTLLSSIIQTLRWTLPVSFFILLLGLVSNFILK